MSNNISFALAFLEQQPEEAAEVLELHSLDDVAKFFNEVPYKYAGPVLEKMLPRFAAKVCYRLDAKVCAGFLSQMKISLATAILRHAKPEVRKKIMELLPEKTTIACKLLLNYAEDMVGAWMDTQVIQLPNDIDVAEARLRVQADELINMPDIMFVVDRQRNLCGVVRPYQLVIENETASLVSCMSDVDAVLPSRASLMSIKKHEGWDTSDVLPVLDRNHKLIGTLRHVDMRKGLNQLSKTIKASQRSGAISEIGNAYAKSLLALLNSASEIAHTKKTGGA